VAELIIFSKNLAYCSLHGRVVVYASNIGGNPRDAASTTA